MPHFMILNTTGCLLSGDGAHDLAVEEGIAAGAIRAVLPSGAFAAGIKPRHTCFSVGVYQDSAKEMLSLVAYFKRLRPQADTPFSEPVYYKGIGSEEPFKRSRRVGQPAPVIFPFFVDDCIVNICVQA